MTESTEHVQTEIAEGVCTITLHRPEKKNALTVAMYADIVGALRAAGDDPAVRIIVLTGTGEVFTAGNDIFDFMNAPPAGPDSPVFQLITLLTDYEKPLISAINGPAIGIGTTLLFHCDLNYAARGAVLRMPFVDLGICPEAGSSLLLPRLVGHQVASELLFFADGLDADRAAALGIVNEVFEPADLLPEVHARARRLAKKPAGALRATKKLLRAPIKEQLQQVIMEEAGAFLERLGSPEAQEAFTAFFEKRSPDFSQFV